MSQQINYEDLDIDMNSPLGSGYIATVYLAKHKKTGEKYAVKVVNMDKVNDLESIALKREIEIHQSLDHPNIVRMYSATEKGSKLYLVLEYLPKGTLFEHMQKDLEDKSIKDIFMQVVEAVNYIHQRGYIHRDIKPENIIQAENGQYKLCDFGFSAEYGKQKKRVTICGTDDYFPPEILQGDEQTEKVDIWCLGILLYELAHKRTPFRDQMFARKQTVSGEVLIKPSMENLLNTIVRKCLKRNPNHRPSAQKVLEMLGKEQKSTLEPQFSKTDLSQSQPLPQNQFQPSINHNFFKKKSENSQNNMGFEKISQDKNNNSIKNQERVFERQERTSMHIVHKLQSDNTYKTHYTTINGGPQTEPKVTKYYVDYKKGTNAYNQGFDLPIKLNKNPIQKIQTCEPRFVYKEQRSFSPAPIRSTALNNSITFPQNRVPVQTSYVQQSGSKSKLVIRLTNDYKNDVIDYNQKQMSNSYQFPQYRKNSKSQEVYRYYKQVQFKIYSNFIKIFNFVIMLFNMSKKKILFFNKIKRINKRQLDFLYKDLQYKGNQEGSIQYDKIKTFFSQFQECLIKKDFKKLKDNMEARLYNKINEFIYDTQNQLITQKVREIDQSQLQIEFKQNKKWVFKNIWCKYQQRQKLLL